MIKNIYLDLDDLQIINEALYDEARMGLTGLIQGYGLSAKFNVSAKQVGDAIDRVDSEMVKTHGYSRKRYPATYEAVVKEFIPDADEQTVSLARSFAEAVFERAAPVKPGVPEAIDLLHADYRLYIITAGDPSVQEKRIAALPYRDKFTEIFIVSKKDAETYADILKKTGNASEESVMMGDSLKSDVIPAVEAGMHGVFIPAKVSGSYHPVHGATPSTLPPERAYTFSSLLEVARHLNQQEGSLVTPAAKPPRRLDK
jgi:putative hydrolase of the HAD superfamily